jgi:hypothetical protein
VCHSTFERCTKSINGDGVSGSLAILATYFESAAPGSWITTEGNPEAVELVDCQFKTLSTSKRSAALVTIKAHGRALLSGNKWSVAAKADAYSITGTWASTTDTYNVGGLAKPNVEDAILRQYCPGGVIASPLPPWPTVTPLPAEQGIPNPTAAKTPTPKPKTALPAKTPTPLPAKTPTPKPKTELPAKTPTPLPAKTPTTKPEEPKTPTPKPEEPKTPTPKPEEPTTPTPKPEPVPEPDPEATRGVIVPGSGANQGGGGSGLGGGATAGIGAAAAAAGVAAIAAIAFFLIRRKKAGNPLDDALDDHEVEDLPSAARHEEEVKYVSEYGLSS